jgi:hypothetical protein
MLKTVKSRSLVAAAVGACLIALTQPPVVANAASATARNSTMSVTSATLRVFAADTMTASSTGTAYVVNINKSTPKTFYIRNTGTLTSTSFSFTITLSNTGAKISSLYRCNVGVYFGTTLKKCGPTNVSGTGIITAPVKPLYIGSQTLTLAPGGWVAFQIDLDTTCDMTFNVSANIANISPTGTPFTS